MSVEHTRVSDSQSETSLHEPAASADASPGEVVPSNAAPREGAAAAGAHAVSAQRPLRPSPTHVTLAVVLQVRHACLSVLLWERAREPFSGAWSLPGGYLESGHTLEESIRSQLARKVDVAELSWLEQLETLSEPDRHPREWQLATAYLGLVPRGLDPAVPPDTAWHPVERLPTMAFDPEPIVLAGRERLRAKLSYTNIGFALAPERFSISELGAIYAAALGYPVSATNLRRVLERRGQLEPTGERRRPGPGGGRPAAPDGPPPRPPRQRSPGRLPHSPRHRGAVLLDQDRVVQAGAVVRRAAQADRLLLELAQAGGRLPRVEDLRPRSIHRPDEARGERRHTRQPAKEVQRHPLAGEDRPCAPLHPGDRARLAPLPLGGDALEAELGVQPQED